MLTDDTLRKVRETARIDEVASGYLTLHRSGKDFVALCPFHDERHPSFRVSPARNIGKCFSCGEAADPIRLVCHMEGCGFEEAVRLLARKYNIEVEETAAAGRVPKDRGAIRSDGNTDRGTTAGNLRRHRPEKRTGTGAEEGSRRPHARPATRKDVTAFLPHAP